MGMIETSRRQMKNYAYGCALTLTIMLASPSLALAEVVDLPLAVAVQKIVPQGQIVVYAPSIDLTDKVKIDLESTLGWEQRVSEIAQQIGVTLEQDEKLIYFNDGTGHASETGRSSMDQAPLAADDAEGAKWLADVANLPPESEPFQVVDSVDGEENEQESGSALSIEEAPSEDAVLAE